MRNPEILAPVGNRAMLDAALAAGADAVYLGGKVGSARAFASNFDDRELEEAIRIAHLHGTKVYLTMNTLVKNDEMAELLSFAETAWRADVDAVILQDIGLAKHLREKFPDLGLHASTQLNVHSLAGVKMMEQLGFERVILGRETALFEVERIRKFSRMEVELFVHGSLCVSVSGQCLFSSLIGGRSGNRGRCAQSCRKNYRTVLPDGKLSEEDSILGLRDLNTLANMELWSKLGIASLKIEGRMKKPAYVYAVTKMLQNALKGEPITQDLQDLSSRAFTKGFTLGDFGRSVTQTSHTPKGTRVGRIEKVASATVLIAEAAVRPNDTLHVTTAKGKILPLTMTRAIAIGERMRLDSVPDAQPGSYAYRVFADRADLELQEALEHTRLSLPLHFTVRGSIGEPLELTASSKDASVRVQTQSLCTIAQKQPISATQIEEKLSKVGTTPFARPVIDTVIEENLFIPIKEVNQLKRDAIEELSAKLARFHTRIHPITPDTESIRAISPPKPELTLEIDENRALDGVNLDRVKRIYTSDVSEIEAYRAKWGIPVYLIQPEPFDESREGLLIDTLRTNSFDGVLARDLSGMEWVKGQKDLGIVCDYTVNCMNDEAALVIEAISHNSTATASIEMSRDESEQALFLNGAEVIAFGPVRAMHLRHCPFSVKRGCKNDNACGVCPDAKGILVDEHGARYYVERKEGYSTLYFHKCFDRIAEWKESRATPATYRLILRTDQHNAEWVDYARSMLIEKKTGTRPSTDYAYTSGFTTGSWKQGVE